MRRAYDAYYTPREAVLELLARRPHIGQPGQIIVEPCVGEGAIAAPFRERGCYVVTNDVVPSIAADVHDDATQRSTWKAIEDYVDELASAIVRPIHDVTRPIDYVVTNPPFVAAMPILKRAYERAGCGVAMFLRLSFLEPTIDGDYPRGAWLAQHPPDDLIVLPRISFTGDGATDSVTCAWMIWYAGHIDDVETLRGSARAIEIVPRAIEPDEAQPALFGDTAQ